MKIFVGLGNPGAKHADQRHNIGFMAVDAIAEANGFGPWRAKFQAEMAEGRFGSEKVVLLKPQTYMNLSGQSVGEAARYLKAAPDEIWVFHDELDLAPGKIRAKTGGGHAGHNGLRSLHQHIGEGYHRIRMGIGHPGHKDRVSGYVLHDFAKADHDWLDPLLDAVAREAGRLAHGDAPGFMSAVALAIRPPEKAGKNDSVTVRKPIGKKITQTRPEEAATATGEDGDDPESILTRLLARFSRK